MPRISGLWRLEAFFDGRPPVDHATRVRVSTWVLSLMDDPVPGEVVSLADRRLGTVYRVIVRGTDVEITYRLLATGTPRLGMYGLTNPS